MGTEAELNGMAMELTYDSWVAQVRARLDRVQNREAVERDVAAVHPGVELEGLVGSVRVGDGGLPYGTSPCVEASDEAAKWVFSGHGEDAKWHCLALPCLALLLIELGSDGSAICSGLRSARCHHGEFRTMPRLRPRRKERFP